MNKRLIKIHSQEGYEFVVKEDFLRKCRRPEEFFSYDLINTYSIINYIANENELFAQKLKDILND